MKNEFEAVLSSASPAITLRPVTPEDESFLLEVYAGTRADELALTNWSRSQQQAFIEMQFAAQQQYYRNQFPEAEPSIILLNGCAAGRLYVDRRDDEIRILDIAMATDFRGRGAGSSILRGVMAEAEKRGVSVRIYVERFNPSRALFERLGFSIVEQTPSHFLMQWRPAPSTGPTDESGPLTSQ
jgi:ribosomal protein S18 acetylase RimI-like enzyme